MSHFIGVGMFQIGLNRTDLGCWRLTLSQEPHSKLNRYSVRCASVWEGVELHLKHLRF